MFEEAEDLLTVPEVCTLLRMGRGAVYTLLASGQRQALRSGRVWLIAEEAGLQFVRQNSGLDE